MLRRALAAAAAAALAFASAAAAAPAVPVDPGWSDFWRTFAAAAAKDDQVTLAKLTQLGPGIGDENTFAKVHHDYLKPSQRTCLAKGHPTRDIDGDGNVNYAVFCGHLIYVFSRTHAGWQWTDMSPDD
jgi:hypothetical protein